MSDRKMPRPPLSCRKCGYDHGFLYSQPTYDQQRDRLSWHCTRCGYTVTTRTADAPQVDPVTGQVLHPDGYPVDEMGG